MSSSETVIPEFKYLLKLVEQHYGRKLSTSADFESLSVIIEKETGDMLSSSTLKRLFGYVSLRTVPRKSTLDILSRFIGRRDYESFCCDLRNDRDFKSMFFSVKAIYSSELDEGQCLRIGWAPNRVVTLRYLGNDMFEVKSSLNASLVAGDRFEQVSFLQGYPLYLARIFRGEDCTPAYVAGMDGGLNLLELVSSED
ncbi:MAG: hypothetical protein ACI3ZH_06710 [Candidatus Cryptobacteroides sp.]